MTFIAARASRLPTASTEAFTACLLMALGSTMLSVPMVAPKLARMKDLVFKQPEADAELPDSAATHASKSAS